MRETYITRVRMNGNEVERGTRDFDYFLLHSPTAHTVMCDRQNYQVAIESNSQRLGFDEQIFLASLSTPLTTGSIIYWNNNPWLCLLTADKSYNTHKRLVMRKCNQIGNFFIDGQHVNIPLVFISDFINTTMIDEALRNNIWIQSKDYEAVLLLPRTTDNLKINKNDRVIINSKAWRIKDHRGEFLENIIALAIEQVMIDEVTDNITLGISTPTDYNPPQVTKVETSNVKYEMKATNKLLLNETFTYKVEKLLGNIPTSIDCMFMIDDYTNIDVVGTTGDSITIHAKGPGTFTITVLENGSSVFVHEVKIIKNLWQ